jgi:hypothetical protein
MQILKKRKRWLTGKGRWGQHHRREQKGLSGRRNIWIKLIIQPKTHPVQPKLQRTLRKVSYATASRIIAARARRKKNNKIEKNKTNKKREFFLFFCFTILFTLYNNTNLLCVITEDECEAYCIKSEMESPDSVDPKNNDIPIKGIPVTYLKKKIKSNKE